MPQLSPRLVRTLSDSRCGTPHGRAERAGARACAHGHVTLSVGAVPVGSGAHPARVDAGLAGVDRCGHLGAAHPYPGTSDAVAPPISVPCCPDRGCWRRTRPGGPLHRVQGLIAVKLGKLRTVLLGFTDRRVKLISEVLQGIRCVPPSRTPAGARGFCPNRAHTRTWCRAGRARGSQRDQVLRVGAQL